MRKLKNYQPDRVFYYFEEITKIPRPSFHEEKIADYIEAFAKSKNLQYYRDSFNNIIVYKEAHKDYIDVEPIILQGHIDMVCEKKPESDHDFSKDPINFEVFEDKIIARETTLGADNGIAVAMILSLLEDEDLQAPKLECLFTANEETGMTGALNLDGKKLSAKRLLNLDSEEEGVLTVSCAGGQRNEVKFKKEYEDLEKGYIFYELSISGLKGGHSGGEIHKYHGNAIVRLARALYRFDEEFNIKLISLSGGGKPNAIPRNSKAKIAIKEEDLKKAQLLTIKLNSEYVRELGKIDPDIRLNFEKSFEEKKCLKEDLKKRIIGILNVMPNGVLTMSSDLKGLVESSSNIGVLEDDGNYINIISALRSNKGTLKTFLSQRIEILSKFFGGDLEILSVYPEWPFEEKSALIDLIQKSYNNLYNKPMEVFATHGGLECGIFKKSIGDIEMASIGPEMHGVHAPGENLSISSTKRTYELIKEILKNTK